MAFKLNYLFEGDFKSRPEQNFSGSARKLTRDALLQTTYEERKKRQDHRLKIRSAEILQTHMKSYLVRKRVKDEQRKQFDLLHGAPLRVLLSRLLFFYYPKEDWNRLVGTCARLLRERDEVRAQIRSDRSMFWLMRRYLSVCLKDLGSRDEENDDNALVESLEVYTEDKALLENLICKGYYKYLRSYLEKDTRHTDSVLGLISRPFDYLSDGIDGYNDIAYGGFSSTFLRPALGAKVKDELLPYVKARLNYSVFVGLIDHLNLDDRRCDDGDDLYYCMLALEPDDFDTNLGLVQILSRSSRSLHRLRPATEDVEDSDEDEERTDEVSPMVGGGQVLFSECLTAMNRPDRVRRWLRYLEAKVDDGDEEVLVALIGWCHNLLLDHKEAIRKYLLLYKLGLNGRFLNRLCRHLRRDYGDRLNSRTLFQNAWSECHVTLSVFCSMFIFYTETLTDEENSDTSGTFTKDDLSFVSKLLKSVAKETIEIAFPMSRTNSLPAMPETQQLYKVALSCLKTLYMLDLREQFCPVGFWSSDKIFIPPDLARNLSDVPLSSYSLFNNNNDDNNTRTNDGDEHMAPLSTIERRSLAILEELPFLIPFNTRILLLRDLCRNVNNETEYQRLHNEFANDRMIVIRRTHLYEDAFEKLFNVVDLKRRTRIQFINSAGLEEAGIDGGGIFKEFLNEVLKTAFDPNRGFFLLTTNNTLYPNPNVHLIVDNYLEHYYFIGRLIGKAVFENILVELPLAEFFLAKLVVDRAPAHYLKSLDPLLYKNLLYLRDCTGDIGDLGLDFTIVNYDLGETRLVELKPDGRNIPVTNENRLEYIQRLADFKLNAQLNKQCYAFRAGISSVVPIRWLKFFDHKELQVIIGGNNQDVDVDDLKAHTLYGGEFTEDHQTIVHFWNVLRSFTDTQKRQLLKFVTSCSRPPLLGFKELNPEFCILSSGTENRMPTASTCLNLLKLPIIEDEETLREKLLEAVQQQAGFELS